MKNKKSIAIAMSAVSTLGAVAPVFACESGDIVNSGQFKGEHLVDLDKINNRDFDVMTVAQYDAKSEEFKNENPVVAITADKNYVVRVSAKLSETDVNNEFAKLERFETEIKSDLEKTYTAEGKELPIYKMKKEEVKREVTLNKWGPWGPKVTVVDYIVTLTSNLKEEYQDKTFRFKGLRLANTGLGYDQELEVTNVTFKFGSLLAQPGIYVNDYRTLNQVIFELNEAMADEKIMVVKFDEEVSSGEIADKTTLKVTLMDGTEIANINIEGIKNIKKDQIKVIPGTNDFKNHWSKDTVVKNMLDGVIDVADEFRPEASITRAEFAKIMVKRFDIGYNNHMIENFTDVKANDWYYEYVTALANCKVEGTDGKLVPVLEGNGDGTFRPDAPITRQEASKMIATLLGQGETYMTDSKGNRVHTKVDTTHIFADGKEIAEWADESVKNLNGIKVGSTSIITGYEENGKTYFKPANNIKRAEALVMMDRAFEAR